MQPLKLSVIIQFGSLCSLTKSKYNYIRKGVEDASGTFNAFAIKSFFSRNQIVSGTSSIIPAFKDVYTKKMHAHSYNI